MQITSLFKCFSILLLATVISVDAGEDWKDMSAGFEGWRQAGNANWHLQDGAFVANAGAGHLFTEESFTDARIRLEFWASEGANSGVFLRISDTDAIADSSAYEVNIFDNRPDQTYRSGALVNFSAPSAIINTPGRWNTYDITFQGDHIKVVLNGITTVDIHDSTYRSGPISLQYVAGTVKFRKVQIRKL